MRRQAFEFHDLAWCPASWRSVITACSGHFAVAFDLFRPIVPRLARAMRACRSDAILDLCSGSAGPLARLQAQLLESEAWPVTIVLSDKYPNLAVLERTRRVSGGRLGFIRDPVDAGAVPAADRRFRTMFTAFHHFEPPVACRILREAAEQRIGIGVFEYTDRSLAWILSAFCSPIFCWLTAPWAVRPFTPAAFVWIYLLPVPVLLMTWDAIVSGLRTYSPAELRALVDQIEAPDYVWDIGRLQSNGFWQVTYLIGRPREDATAGAARGTVVRDEPGRP